MKVKSVKENYLLGLIRSASGLLFPVVTFAYASRVLSVSGIGKVDFAKSVIAYFTYFATLGVSTYGIREAAKVRDNKRELSKVVKEIFMVNIISTAAAYLLFFISLAVIPGFGRYRGLLLICSISIGFTALGLDWLYSAVEEYRYITARTLLFQVLSLLALPVLVKGTKDFYNYAFIMTFSTVGSNLFNFFHARHYIDLKYTGKLNLKRHVRPILLFFSNSIAGNIYQTLDTSMVGLLSTEHAVGLYSASVKMNRICVGMVTALPTILLPRISYYVELGAKERYENLMKQSFHCILMVSFPLAVYLFAMSDEILVLFSGSGFLAASSCTKVLASIVLFIPVSSFAANQILIPFGKERQQFISTLAGAASDLVLNLCLIPRFSHMGAAVGTAVAVFLVAAITMAMASKCIDIRFLFSGAWHYVVASLILLFIVSSLRGLLSGVASYILPVLAGAFAYIVLLAAMHDALVSEILKIIRAYLTKAVNGGKG